VFQLDYLTLTLAGEANKVPLTFKVKARRYPPWHYAIATVFSMLGSAFWAWVAYSAFAVTLSVAKQVFIVLATLSLLFLGLMYIAYERQFRNHRSKAVPKVASAFGASMMLATLYFLSRYDADSTARTPVLIISVVSIAIGVYVSVFLIKYEVD
jgi:hypothetical protein